MNPKPIGSVMLFCPARIPTRHRAAHKETAGKRWIGVWRLPASVGQTSGARQRRYGLHLKRACGALTPSRIFTHGRPRPVDDQLRMLPAHGVSDVAAEAQRQRCLQRFWQPLGWDFLPLGG